MAKLCRNRWFYALLLTSVYLLSASSSPVLAANSGSIFLDNKEREVQLIAAAAEENHGRCDLVSSCDGPNCSRATCVPVNEDKAMSKCTIVNNNTACPADSGGHCEEMMLNLQKSYITLPKGTDAAKIQMDVRRDICLQRGLDTTFMDIYKNQSQYSYMYYGSTSGAWRAFPGRESEEFCYDFECRQRPWYLDGISVRKQVRILIDTGSSDLATAPYGRGEGTTLLDVANNLSLSIIQTLSPEDFVDVISFDSTGAYSLVTSPVKVGNYNQSAGVVVNTELEPLRSKVRSLKPSKVPGKSNLTAAIVKGISSFQNTSLPYLKLVVVISDGNFLPLDATTFPAARILAEKAKLLIYRFPSNSGVDPYLVQTNLQTVLSGVQGSFEVLDAPSTANPLFAIRSYFSFLAKVHMASVQNKPLWSNVYTSIAQSLPAITVTYPAFDSDGELIGVAAIDVFHTVLEVTLQDEIREDLKNRVVGTRSAPEALTLNHTYQLSEVAVAVCSKVAFPPNGIICERSDDRELKERVCCNSCAIKGPPGSGFPTWAIIFLAVVGSLVVVGICVLLCIYREFVKDRWNGIVSAWRERHRGPCCGNPAGPAEPGSIAPALEPWDKPPPLRDDVSASDPLQ